MHVIISQKNDFVEKVLPAKFILFVYVSMHTLRLLTSLTTLDTFKCIGCRGNASDCDAKGHWFSFQVRQGILDFIFCLDVVACLLLVHTPLFARKYCHSFSNAFWFISTLYIVQSLWLYIRIWRYRHSIIVIWFSTEAYKLH